MSVICFSKEEFQKIGNSILNLQLHGTFKLRIFKDDEIDDTMKAFKLNKEKALKVLTEWMMTKWSIANQVAYLYQYHDREGSNKLDYHEFELDEFETFGNKILYQEITFIEYNCEDNEGNDFTPEFITEKVQKIKNYLAYKEFHKEVEQ